MLFCRIEDEYCLNETPFLVSYESVWQVRKNCRRIVETDFG